MRRALADARRNTSLALVFLVVLATTIGLASRGETKLIPGSKNPKNDCLIEADIDGVTGRGPQVTCTDGDRCDHDGSCPNRSCRFRIRACIDQTNVPGCSGGPIGKARAFVKVGKRKTMLPLPADRSGLGCGAFVDVDVPVKGKKKAKHAMTGGAMSSGSMSNRPMSSGSMSNSAGH